MTGLSSTSRCQGTPSFVLILTLACLRSTTADRTMLTTWLTWPTVSSSVARTSHVCHSCARTGQFYDWNAFLGQWFRPLVELGRCHTFVFDREHPNVMIVKLMPDDSNQDATKLNILKLGVTIQAILDAYQRLVMPPVLIPSGLSAQRSQYLYDKVREYVRDPRKKDGFCPKPSLAINLSSAAENVCAQDQPGPSTAIPGPSTAKGHAFNDEDKGRKRRPNSELNLVYRCPQFAPRAMPAI